MESRMIVIMLILKRSALNKYLLIEVPLSEKIAFGRGVHTRWALAGQMTFLECVSLNITCSWSYNQKELGTYILAKFNHMPFFHFILVVFFPTYISELLINRSFSSTFGSPPFSRTEKYRYRYGDFGKYRY